MYINNKLLIGKNDDKEVCLLPSMANRHGLITGASGTGKTITLKVMAESFSDAGVPVFLADVKGDLAGTAVKGEASDAIIKRVEKLKLEGYDYKDYPVRFWDLYQEYGHALRASIYDVGASVLAIMLGLSEVQEGVLSICYRIAHDEEMMIYSLEDLRTLLNYVGEHKSEYTLKYGNITSQSIGVIQRSLLALEDQGADKFFGLPTLDIRDFIQNNYDGRGYINILHAVELFNSPDLYAAFLLHLLNRLYRELPEVGDLERPKMVFFFDEAHLLFNGMPPYRLKQIVQVVKLIRSKGVGLYFISQSPTDIPDEVIAQLGNRVQHNLRAYTPSELKAVKVAADAFRANPNFNTEEAIKELGTGEALISFQNENGEPEVVERATILPPQSKMGTLDMMERNKIINNSSLCGKYEEEIFKEDAASVVLGKKADEERAQREAEEQAKEEERIRKEEEKEALAKAKEEEKLRKEEERAKKEAEREAEKKKREEERERKNSIGYKLGKKATNKVVDKALNKAIGSAFKKFFK